MQGIFFTHLYWIESSNRLNEREIELYDISEIFADGFGTRDNFTVSRQQQLHIQVGHAFNAFLERCAIPAGKIGAADYGMLTVFPLLQVVELSP